MGDEHVAKDKQNALDWEIRSEICGISKGRENDFGRKQNGNVEKNDNRKPK